MSSKVGKVKQSIKNCLNQNLVLGTFLENGFEASLSSKTNVLSVWKWYFSVFSNFWVTNLKPFSGKVRQNIKNCLNQNLIIGDFLDFFWSFLALKNKYCRRLKITWFSFLQIFDWRSWNHCLGKWGKVFKTIWINIWP